MPVSVVPDPENPEKWRLREPNGRLLPKKYDSKREASEAAAARNLHHAAD